jgi:pyruvate dehydrogenase E2 component (dihydrolipoamide acetyltransferase)/2-oxoisovalerate dehydrogenase E2 component (dihydrolipoyl transacylase)
MDFNVPELGEGVYEAEFVAWHVKPGDKVKRGQVLMEVMTDKATMEVPSPFAGTIGSLKAEPGQVIKVGRPILTYQAEGEEAPAEAHAEKKERRPRKAAVAKAEAVPMAPPGNGPKPVAPLATLAVKAAPSVRLMARKLGLDLTNVPGTGPGGRVLVQDLTRLLQSAPASAAKVAESIPDYGTPGTRIKLIGLRRKIAERMVQSKTTIPHYSYMDECDVTDLVRLRDSLKDTFNQSGIKLTYLAFFVKAVVGALKEVPLVNASLDGEEIVLHDQYHVGIAVAAPGGLIVPVVRDADRRSLADIAREIERLSAATRTGKATREELTGSTFTITSIGSIGGLISTPVINPPEVGILGIGKIAKRPVYDPAGNIRPADIVYLSFSFDHRVLDGAVGAAFGNAVARRLQTPAALLLPEKLS